MSTPQVQHIVQLLQEDVDKAVAGRLDLEQIRSVARIGSHGTYAGNTLRDLDRQLGQAPLNEALHGFSAPLKSDLVALHTVAREQQLILPHVVFATIFNSHQSDFRRLFSGGDGALRNFWSDMVNHPCYDRCAGDPGWENRTVPLALHGDGTPVAGVGKSWSRLMDIFSFSSLLAVGSTLDFTLLIYAVFTQLATKSSMETVWTLICWSFKWLAKGVWPDEDAYGRK